jgi:hypothetical protein
VNAHSNLPLPSPHPTPNMAKNQLRTQTLHLGAQVSMDWKVPGTGCSNEILWFTGLIHTLWIYLYTLKQCRGSTQRQGNVSFSGGDSIIVETAKTWWH